MTSLRHTSCLPTLANPFVVLTTRAFQWGKVKGKLTRVSFPFVELFFAPVVVSVKEDFIRFSFPFPSNHPNFNPAAGFVPTRNSDLGFGIPVESLTPSLPNTTSRYLSQSILKDSSLPHFSCKFELHTWQPVKF